MTDVTLDAETADKIALNVLVAHYEMNEKEIKKLSKKKKREAYEEEDLEHNFHLRMYLKGVIRYFTTVDQYEEIVGEIK